MALKISYLVFKITFGALPTLKIKRLRVELGLISCKIVLCLLSPFMGPLPAPPGS